LLHVCYTDAAELLHVETDVSIESVAAFLDLPTTGAALVDQLRQFVDKLVTIGQEKTAKSSSNSRGSSGSSSSSSSSNSNSSTSSSASSSSASSSSVPKPAPDTAHADQAVHRHVRFVLADLSVALRVADVVEWRFDKLYLPHADTVLLRLSDVSYHMSWQQAGAAQEASAATAPPGPGERWRRVLCDPGSLRADPRGQTRLVDGFAIGLLTFELSEIQFAQGAWRAVPRPQRHQISRADVSHTLRKVLELRGLKVSLTVPAAKQSARVGLWGTIQIFLHRRDAPVTGDNSRVQAEVGLNMIEIFASVSRGLVLLRRRETCISIIYSCT
jgi:hypothetical protein